MKKNSATNKIFVVEDEPMYRRLVEYTLKLNPEHEVMGFGNAKDCLDKIHLNPKVIILDHSLPDITGVELMKRIKKLNSEIEFIVLSGQKDISVAVAFLKEGAYDYINKDDQTSVDLKNRLLNTVNNIVKKQQLKEEVTYLRQELSDKYEFSNTIKGNSVALKRVFALLEKAARTNITVSITGETGTGKELVAKAIHYNSVRKKEPFVAVNVSAIPRDLLESDLFGHEKGAFTGAVTRQIGKFEQADKGSLFLDEIGEMDINMQAKLLRVLQERELVRIGGRQTIKIDTRIIVATHQNLQEMVAEGTFRQDLYYRLLGLPIKLPPLRQRGNDALILARYFLDDFCKENGLPKMEIMADAKEKVLNYAFPGNIRELKAVIELAAVLTNDETISANDIQFSSALSINNLLNDEQSLKAYNQHIVRYFLDKYDNNVITVAKKLDIGKSTIYRMLKEME